jgi:hypothetical protein
MRQRPTQHVFVLGCALLVLSIAWNKTDAHAYGTQFDRAQTNNGVLGPAIQALLSEPLPRRELRRLVTDVRTIRDHPDLAEYYRKKASRLEHEAEKYERYMRAAGDTIPLNMPNHYGTGRNARFDYVVAKADLKQARNDKILAALNSQAEQREGCFECHTLHGHGGNIGPELGIERTRKRSHEWLIGHFRDPQTYSPGSVMPALRGLTSDQLEILTRFLQYQREAK